MFDKYIFNGIHHQDSATKYGERIMRNNGEVTPAGTILSELKVLDNDFFPVIERVVRSHEGEVRKPHLIWDRSDRKFAIAVVTDSDGKFVLVEENKYGQMMRMTSAPTGGVRKSETEQEAAERELFEETGYVAESWKLVTESPIVDFGDKIDGGHHFVFTACNATPKGVPRNKDQKVVIVTREELCSLAVQGRMPAMSLAAFFIALYR